jgi:hypothetical protein
MDGPKVGNCGAQGIMISTRRRNGTLPKPSRSTGRTREGRCCARVASQHQVGGCLAKFVQRREIVGERGSVPRGSEQKSSSNQIVRLAVLLLAVARYPSAISAADGWMDGWMDGWATGHNGRAAEEK